MLFSIFINKLNFIWIKFGSIEIHRYDITKSGIDALPNLIIVLCIKSIAKLIKLRLCTRMVSVFLYSDDISFKAHAYFVDLRFLFHWVENSTVSNVSFDTYSWWTFNIKHFEWRIFNGILLCLSSTRNSSGCIVIGIVHIMYKSTLT